MLPLSNSLHHILRHLFPFCRLGRNSVCNSPICTSPAVRVDNQLMRRVVHVDIFTEDHDFVLVAKQRRYLLERHALCLGKENPRP